VLKVESVDVGAPGPGQVRLRQTAVGVNFHDIYVRSGLYKTLPLPGIPGLEAVGVVEAVGSEVGQVKVGDRVGCLTLTYGSYAQARLAGADALIKLPDSLDERTAAGTLLRGLTAQMLAHHVHKIGPGLTVLVHAASGGVGRLLCQWAHHLGATVIGTVGSEEKARSARENGCDHVILYRTENFVERVQAITGGRGVDVAYDSVGKDTFMGSMTCLARLGHLVNFGQASGPVDPIPLSLLFQKSNSVTRPNLFHYIADHPRREEMAASLFKALADGIITPGSIHEYRFEDVGRAQRDMEDRKTAGAVVLTL
jgi:NADPH2:quinone reductase